MNINHFLVLINLICTLLIRGEPLVKLSQGVLNGTVKIARYGRCFSSFLGVPYAKSPTGNRRFKNPERATPWKGIRAANSFGNTCPQNNDGVISGNDDCLFLNVYSPFLNFKNPMPSKKLLPVMVWIHGGSFLIGSGNNFGGEYFLEKDIILVTMNYRLGILGFLTTNDQNAAGNFGLKDQVEALKWVRRNIKSFGGDPQKVTLFGQSAGGVSVNLHSISRASRGLFHKYIIHSGTVVGPGAYQEPKNSIVHLKNLANLFNCSTNTSQTIVNCLRKVNSDDLVKTTAVGDTILKYGHFIWNPTIESDSPEAFLTENPLNSVNNNKMKDLPFMSGTVADEGLTFTNGAYANDDFYQSLRSNINKTIIYLSQHYKQQPRKLFSAMDKFYFNDEFTTSSKNEFLNGMTKFLSDLVFFYPQVRMLEKVTPNMKNSNYFYNFGYRGSVSLSTKYGDTRNRGVDHEDELLYLFPLNFESFKTSNTNFTRVDEKISKIMVDFWSSFAINGKPTSNELMNPNLWGKFATNNTAHIQIGHIKNNTDPAVSMSKNYYTEQINFWKKNAPI